MPTIPRMEYLAAMITRRHALAILLLLGARGCADQDQAAGQCAGDGSVKSDAEGNIERADLSPDWQYQVEAATEGCLSPCDTCVTTNNVGGRNYCSHLCETDKDCGAGETCFGCWEVRACVKLCATNADCSFDETCELGQCLWAT
jgi:hypothetical protein